MKRRHVFALCLGLLAICLAALALARPGGGQTYSGSSSSSSSSSSSGSGSSGGGGEALGMLFELLIWLCFEHPTIGIPLLIGVVLGWLFLRSSSAAGKAWDSSSMSGASELRRKMADAGRELDARRGVEQVGERLEGIRSLDPEFSLVLFEDFLYSLYAEVHRARGAGTLERLSPYVRATAHTGLTRGHATRVEAVVIGVLRPRTVEGVDDANAERVTVVVEFQANYTELENDDPQTYYVVESWRLSRDKKARSRPPKRARVIDCPNCGAPLDKVVNATCSFCKTAVGSGDFDWMLEEVEVEAREPRPPALVGDVEERGTKNRTVVHSDAQQRFHALQARDAAVTLPALESRAQLIFSELQRAWAARELLLARAYLSDRLFETLGYWLEAYREAGLRNQTDDSELYTSELARVVSDAHFDSVTLRIFATGLDYTLDEKGEVVSGSRSKPRDYSEYWTLIRGSKVSGAPRTDSTCPSCGAPLDINMAGSCNHCRAEVTSGDFDWVLSRIEQDDDY